MRLIHSTTFQLAVIVLTIGAIAAWKTEDITWLDWMKAAMEAVFFYAAKEIGRYGAEAYKERKNV